MSWFGIACELHRDWRNDVEGLGALFSNHLPSYRCLITSYTAVKGRGCGLRKERDSDSGNPIMRP